MTVVERVVVRCDMASCTTEFRVGMMSGKEAALTQAATNGWEIASDGHYCPEHAHPEEE